jgi:hypothetical protein
MPFALLPYRKEKGVMLSAQQLFTRLTLAAWVSICRIKIILADFQNKCIRNVRGKLVLNTNGITRLCHGEPILDDGGEPLQICQRPMNRVNLKVGFRPRHDFQVNGHTPSSLSVPRRPIGRFNPDPLGA